MLVKKEVFRKVGMLDENIYWLDDHDIWIRFAKAGMQIGVASYEKPLWVYRIREDSQVHATHDKKPGLLGRYRLIKKHKKEAIIRDSLLRTVFAERMWKLGIGMIKCRECQLLGMKALFEAQLISPNMAYVFSSLYRIFNRIVCLKKLKV